MSEPKDRLAKDQPRSPSRQRLKDIADLAGVSISTVSRALNNSPLVNAETRTRVQAIARSNRYRGVGRDHGRADRSGTVSVVATAPQGREPGFTEPFLLQLVGGIADAAREKDTDVLVSHVMASKVENLTELIDAGRTDGLIILGQCDMHQDLNRLADHGVPFVVWGAKLDDQRYCSVGSDNELGGCRATEHLLRLGRKRIAFLGDVEAPEAAQRFAGYQLALHKAGIGYDPNFYRPAQFHLESGLESLEALMSSGTGVDGIVAASDIIAMGALKGLEQRGIRVPEDISVVGYDDIPLARYITPALTTIRQDVAAAGRLLLSKLALVREGNTVRSEIMPSHLIVRDSCGA